jgi:putative ABC transport system substrate-binding protein
MRRREFIAGLGGAVAWPLAVQAQQSAVPVIGFLDNTSERARAVHVLAFRQGLSEVGFVEGHNVAIEFRWAEGKLDQLPALASDLVRRKVAVIATNAQYSLRAVSSATSTIPIVFVTGGDPINNGYVTSLNQPTGNVTGISFNSAALIPKRLELLSELVPKPAVIAVLFDASVFEETEGSVETAARELGRQIVVRKPTSASEFDSAFSAFVQAGAGALLVVEAPYLVAQRRQLVLLAARYALPAAFSQREAVEVGGLMSYGASSPDAYRRVGIYVGRILKAAR